MVNFANPVTGSTATVTGDFVEFITKLQDLEAIRNFHRYYSAHDDEQSKSKAVVIENMYRGLIH